MHGSIGYLLRGLCVFEHNRRHKENGDEPETPMSRVYCLKNGQ